MRIAYALVVSQAFLRPAAVLQDCKGLDPPSRLGASRAQLMMRSFRPLLI